ncbi:Sodium-and chloride-dependent GABA transporter 1 [Nibea albiflora]|uniref:Sodium-and chloride-dependent GABA transporter 1 n=1 Tax=Nibea albiflora TaxID=240163 RepID=A0ACB7FC38_NIBAL|nr:Sodium-and chloride-dependent GABA transporter 1 [Nibea albiflora]
MEVGAGNSKMPSDKRDYALKPSDLKVTGEKTEVSEPQRPTWSGRLEFILASVGYAVGLGNVWRFPYLCYSSGGGVGLATVVISFVFSTYYNVLMSWAFYYLYNSFGESLPWKSCNNTWNAVGNCSSGFPGNNTHLQSAGQQFFDHRLLEKSSGIEEAGGLRWELFGFLILSWVIVYLCIFKGVKSTGKVVYFTAIFPYFILFALLINNVQLPGAKNGILYFVTPVWSKLFEVKFATVEVAITFIKDEFGREVLRFLKREELLTLLVCFLCFILGLPHVTRGGIYIFQLMDHYTAVVSLIILAFFEVVAVCWIFGVPRISLMVKRMQGKTPSIYFRLCWLLLCPILVLCILFSSIIQYTPAKYGKYTYPLWAEWVGWLVSLVSVVWIPLGAIHELCKNKGSFLQRLKTSMTPTIDLDAEDSMPEKQNLDNPASEALFTSVI